jgi:hypothetical protein
MRLLNFILHLLITAVLFCAAQLYGQTQGNAPKAIDAYASAAQMLGGTGACGASAGCVNFVEGVSSDDLIVCGAGQEHVPGPGLGCAFGVPQGNDPPWTFSDNIGFTWNMQTSTVTVANPTPMQIGYACASSTQATYRVSWSGYGAVCQSSFECTRYKNVCHSGSATLDGSMVTTLSTTGAGVSNATSSVTTTRTNDLLATVAVHNNGSGSGLENVPDGTPPLALTVTDTGMPASHTWMIAPTLGSNNVSMSGIGGNASQQMAMQTLAFKLPIALADTVLPQCAIGVACSAQLHCQGSLVSNPTYALASGSLPTGLALNTATGLISGTPTGSPSAPSLGFTCTDGTTTSATDTMVLTVGAGFNSIIIGPTSSGNLSLIPATFNLSVRCGDMILILADADDTHNGQGYIQTINGSVGFISDSAGSPIQSFLVNAGINRAPLVAWVLGPVTISGLDQITATNGTGSSSGLHYYAYDIENAQSVLDTNTGQTISAQANGSLSSSYTTVVPNQMVFVATATTGGTSTITYSAPFTLDLLQTNPETFASGHSLVTSPSTVTATSNITEPSSGCPNGANFCDNWTTLLAAFRPAVPGTCSFSGSGEKKRRSMN